MNNDNRNRGALPQKVGSIADLVSFLRMLAKDKETNDGEWENETVEEYLNAIAAWLETAPSNPDVPKEGEIKVDDIAEIFYVGKVYE